MTGETSGAETTQATGTDGAGGGFDQNIMSMIGHTQQTTEQLGHKTASMEQTLSKLEKVFSKEEAKPDQWYDDVLRTAMEAEKQGQPIPLTVQIATQLRQAQANNEQLMNELAELKKREGIRSNPEFTSDTAAYNQIDMYMARELESAFQGNVPKPLAQAITADLVEKIQQEQRSNPDNWRSIRSNPQTMQKIVKNAVAQFIPPQARQIAQQHAVENAQYGEDEIVSAIREAQELLTRPEVQNDPKAQRRIHEAIERSRSMYWEAKMLGQKGKARV